MIGYGQPDPSQLPRPGDEDHERRAAEEYAGRRRARRRIGWITLAVIAVVVVIVLVGHHRNTGALTYQFEQSGNGVKAILADDRSGKHTVWATLRNAQGKLVLHGFASFRDGDQGGGQSVSTSLPLPAGTYTYAVYDLVGIHYTASAKDGPAKDRIASGTVTLP